MKIFGADNAYNQAKIDELRSRERSAPVKSGKSGDGASQVRSSETVAVSGMAREIGKIKSAVHDTPDVRKEKIQAIKESIAKGEYHVSGDKIAGKIIEDIIKQGK